jgi:hypothetical protein
MMLVSMLFGRANDYAFSSSFHSQLEAMLDFIASLMDAGGHVPMVGDSDDAPIVRFAPTAGYSPYRPLLAAGAVLFSRGDFKRKAVSFDDAARWMLGDEGAAAFDKLPADPDARPRRSFADAGYYVLGSNFDRSNEIRLIADAGRLGYLTTAGHGHSDALSFTLSLGGKEILVDPGTYGYQVSDIWRDYFRGTSAHNTVRIDGEDQSVSGGTFLWQQKAHAACERFEIGNSIQVWEGLHDGYRRLPDPVTHRRRIELDSTQGCIRVVDMLAGHGRHRAEIFWHFSEHCLVHLGTDEVVARNDGIRLSLRMMHNGWSARLVTGDTLAPQGWISRRYGQKTPAPTVVFSGEFSGSIEIVTECLFEMPLDADSGTVWSGIAPAGSLPQPKGTRGSEETG